MALSGDAHPKRHFKKALNPDFVYDLPMGSLFQDALNLEQGNLGLREQSTKPAAKSTKSNGRPVTLSAASPQPLATDAGNSPTLLFEQQLQLVKLQKEKLELELKVLAMSHQERPLENMS